MWLPCTPPCTPSPFSPQARNDHARDAKAEGRSRDALREEAGKEQEAHGAHPPGTYTDRDQGSGSRFKEADLGKELFLPRRRILLEKRRPKMKGAKRCKKGAIRKNTLRCS